MDRAEIRKELQEVNFTTEQATALSHTFSHVASKDDVHGLRQHVDAGFKEVYQEFGKLRQELVNMHREIGTMHKEMGSMHKEMGSMHQQIGQFWWKLAVLLILQSGLIVSLIELV